MTSSHPETGPKTAVVTGASSGIGKELAKALAAQGWRVIGTGRDPGRIASAKAEIEAASTGAGVEMLQADLSMLKEAEATAAMISTLTDRLDLLVNNAGGMTDRLEMTSEGYERNFAGNHLGPFVLTRALTPLLKATAKAEGPGAVRILMTSSNASEMIPGINLDDMQNLANWSEGAAYCTGKLANVLFARALASRLASDGITAHSVHPGRVDSNFFTYASQETRDRVADMPMVNEADGADTLLWLATGDEGGGTSGLYWHQRQSIPPNPVVEDEAIVERFWIESEKLVDR